MQNIWNDETQRQSRFGTLKQWAIVAAVLFLVATVTALAPRLAHSAARIELSSVSQRVIPTRSAVHDIGIEQVDRGREGLELSARLSEDGGPIRRPIGWTIRAASGEPVFARETEIADVALAPGDYRIEARYGTAALARDLTLPEGHRLIVRFVLDIGGLRILSRLGALGSPAIPAKSLIYAADGPRRGQLIATSSEPGEIVRVSAGLYRIESRFAAGNAVAVTDVKVKPGLMSAVEIDHKAGLARLAVAGQATEAVRWTVTGEDGLALGAIAGPAPALVLRPGTYTAEARSNGTTLRRTFTIAAGEEIEILVERP